MTFDLGLTLVVVFISVALAAGSLASLALVQTAPERRRLQAPRPGVPRTSGLDALKTLFRPASDQVRQLAKTPRGASIRASKLQRRLEAAGWRDPSAANYYGLAEMVSPVVCGLIPCVSKRGQASIKPSCGPAMNSRSRCPCWHRSSEPSPARSVRENPDWRRSRDLRVERAWRTSVRWWPC
jgi:hypothetical protein